MGTYYADFYDEIPLGIVNKSICGCGASSFALENNKAVVLVVPNVAMIHNKLAQYPNSRRSEPILGIFCSVNPATTIPQYLESTKVPKIMVTYDSFPKLLEYIDNSFHIIVDEFQCLIDDYNFRKKAINNLLDVVFKFDKLSFISATPIIKQYLPDCLVNLPTTTLTWENTIPVIVYPTQTTKLFQTMKNIVEKYRNNLMDFNGHKSYSAYFYVNSVSLIKKIITNCKLKESEVRIICAKSTDNSKTLGRLPIKTSEHPEKMFNFITSTAFKGSDFYSESGIAFVISDNKHRHSLVSIDTEVYQISGRIRNESNPFRNILCHIFNQTVLSLTEPEFNVFLNEKIIRSNNILDAFINSTKAQQISNYEVYSGNKIENVYIKLEESYQLIQYDNLNQLQEERIYHTIIKPYQSGLSVISTYKKDPNFQVGNDKYFKKLAFATTASFSEICKMFVEGKIDLETVDNFNPIIRIADSTIGKEQMKACGYSLTRIKYAVDLFNSQTSIDLAIKHKFKSGFYTIPQVKAMLKDLYEDLQINKTAKASDIEPVFNIKVNRKQINANRLKGYNVP